MEITYRNTLLDIVQFNLYQIPRAVGMRIAWVILTAVYGWIAFDLASSPELSWLGKLITFGIVFGIGSITTIASLLVYLVVAFYLIPKDRPKDCRLVATADGIQTETPTTRSEFKWSGIRSIRRTRQHIFIFVADASALVVPLRAFPAAPQAEQFHSVIVGLCKSAALAAKGADIG